METVVIQRKAETVISIHQGFVRLKQILCLEAAGSISMDSKRMVCIVAYRESEWKNVTSYTFVVPTYVHGIVLLGERQGVEVINRLGVV